RVAATGTGSSARRRAGREGFRVGRLPPPPPPRRTPPRPPAPPPPPDSRYRSASPPPGHRPGAGERDEAQAGPTRPPLQAGRRGRSRPPEGDRPPPCPPRWVDARARRRHRDEAARQPRVSRLRWPSTVALPPIHRW